MISNQIRIQPFLAKTAQQSQSSVPELLDKIAESFNGPDGKSEVASPEFQGPFTMAQSLRLKQADQQELVGQLKQRGVDPNVANALAQGMAVAALGLDPASAAGFDIAFRTTQFGEKPLEKSSLNEAHELTITPALEKASSDVGTDVDSFLAQAVAGFKAHPEVLSDPDQQATTQIASVFKTDAAEIGKFDSKLTELGLDAPSREVLISGLVLNAVAYEPAFRDGLNVIASEQLAAASDGGTSESALEPA